MFEFMLDHISQSHGFGFGKEHRSSHVDKDLSIFSAGQVIYTVLTDVDM